MINGDSGVPKTAPYVCGYFGFDAGLFNLLLDALPRMFGARTTKDWLSNLALAGVAKANATRWAAKSC